MNLFMCQLGYGARLFDPGLTEALLGGSTGVIVAAGFVPLCPCPAETKN